MQVQVLFSMDKVQLSDEELSVLNSCLAQWKVIDETLYPDIIHRILVDVMCDSEKVSYFEQLLNPYNPIIICVCDVEGNSIGVSNLSEYKKFIPSGEIVHQFFGIGLKQFEVSP